MTVDVRTTVNSDGFAVVRLPDLATDPRAELQTLGRLIELPGVFAVQILSPRNPDSATSNTYSGHFGMGGFPLHTDLAHWYRPPRYLVLGCIFGAKSVGTLVYDSTDIVEEIGRALLSRALVRPRRPLRVTRPLLRLLERDAGGSARFRFDSLFLQPANAAGLTALEVIGEHLRACEPERIVLGRTGDAVVIDNWRMLHGREAIPYDGQNRKIARMYLGDLT